MTLGNGKEIEMQEFGKLFTIRFVSLEDPALRALAHILNDDDFMSVDERTDGDDEPSDSEDAPNAAELDAE